VRTLAPRGQSGSGRRLLRMLSWVSSFALAVSSASTARAQAGETPGTTGVGRGFVEMAVAASDDDTAALVDALRELVGRLGLGLRAARADAPPWANGTASTDRDERARVFIDNRFADRIEITASAVKDGVASAPVTRTVPRAESTTIVVEQVAHAVHATLESLLSIGPDAAAPPEANAAPTVQPLAVAPAPVPASDTSPPGPARRRGGFGLDAAAFASGRGMASNIGPVIGGGGAVNLAAWHGPLRPSLWIGGSYNAAFDTQEPGVVALETAVTSLRAVPSVELLALSLLQVDLGVGGGADIFHTVPGSAGLSVAVGATKTLGDPVLTAQLIARIRVISGARLLVGVDVDDDVRGHRYTSKDGAGNSTPVLEPWPVRPSAMIGLCVPLVGAAACASRE
jgi:hypothetical protein